MSDVVGTTAWLSRVVAPLPTRTVGKSVSPLIYRRTSGQGGGGSGGVAGLGLLSRDSRVFLNVRRAMASAIPAAETMAA